MFSLLDKVAIVTGGAGDLGFAIAEAYSVAGAFVVLVGRDPDNLDLAIKKLSNPHRAITVPADVSDEDQVYAMVETVTEKYGSVDILVTAAGIQHRSSVLNFESNKWEQILKVNLTGAFYCAKAVAKYMANNKFGRIILISSLTAEIGIPNISAYAASRGGVRQFAKTLAVELAQDGVTVNCIGPGRFFTSMTADIFRDESKRKRFLSMIPMGGAGRPEDLAGISIFLASDSSGYITGQSFYVDGGWLASGGNVLG